MSSKVVQAVREREEARRLAALPPPIVVPAKRARKPKAIEVAPEPVVQEPEPVEEPELEEAEA